MKSRRHIYMPPLYCKDLYSWLFLSASKHYVYRSHQTSSATISSLPFPTTPMSLKLRAHKSSINPVLTASSTFRKYYRSTGICFNLRNSPQTTYMIPFSILLESATLSPVREMRIIIHPLHRVRLVVDLRDVNYITVGHLMSMVHQYLRQCVTWKEWGNLSVYEQNRVAGAFFDRCGLSSHPSYDVRRGVRRIDLLCSDIYFCGLVPDKARKGTWKMILGRPWCVSFSVFLRLNGCWAEASEILNWTAFYRLLISKVSRRSRRRVAIHKGARMWHF